MALGSGFKGSGTRAWQLFFFFGGGGGKGWG